MEAIATVAVLLLGASVCLQTATLCVLLASRRAAGGAGAAIATAARQAAALVLPAVLGALLGRSAAAGAAWEGLARAADAPADTGAGVKAPPPCGGTGESGWEETCRDRTPLGEELYGRLFQAVGG